MKETIQIRVDSKLKERAASLFASFGMDTTSAVRLFLTQALNQKRLPFEVTAPKEEELCEKTIAKMDEPKSILEGKVRAKNYKNVRKILSVGRKNKNAKP